MHEDVAEILLTQEQIAVKVAELGKQISQDYEGKDLGLICILKGASIFAADLVRHIELPISLDFMAISSYGMGTKTSGVVRILKDLDHPIQGRHILVVEDIVDTGLTLKYLLESLRSRQPASLHVCTLLDKPSRRRVEIEPDYNGFHIPDKFVVGYGLDFDERYRNLPYIGVLKPEVYQRELAGK
ncbi:MAG: hypoxanthine phosphoribosyltransferase [Limnochordaceae bacterium]|nr:hypoxanthine phosphoribosyltransferase [Limnochordaceae bacterium]